MFINKRYRIRHKILDALQHRLTQFDDKRYVNREQIELSIEEISKYSGISLNNIHKNVEYLSDIGEIRAVWDKDIQKFTIIKNGTISFYNRKHILEGRKEFWSNTYDIVKTVSTIILLVIALISFIINIIETSQNNKDIINIKKELLNIKGNK